MAEVLVLVDHVEGAIKKSTYELLTVARGLGEPSAVVVGTPGTASKLVDELREYGAEKVYVAEGELTDFLSPQVGVLAALVERVDPAAVLIGSSADGKEIAGRLAVRTGSGWLNDVVAVSRHDATHSVFGGAWTVAAAARRAGVGLVMNINASPYELEVRPDSAPPSRRGPCSSRRRSVAASSVGAAQGCGSAMPCRTASGCKIASLSSMKRRPS